MNVLKDLQIDQLINKLLLVCLSISPLDFTMLKLTLLGSKLVLTQITITYSEMHDLGVIGVSCPKHLDCLDIVPKRV